MTSSVIHLSLTFPTCKMGRETHVQEVPQFCHSANHHSVSMNVYKVL